jgi:hypothetical protein
MGGLVSALRKRSIKIAAHAANIEGLMPRSDQYNYINSEFINILPVWAQELATKYGSRTASLYILYGNIRDLLPHERNEDEFIFTRVQDYISDILFGNQDIIAYYDCSSGVSFCEPEMERDYIATAPKFASST